MKRKRMVKMRRRGEKVGVRALGVRVRGAEIAIKCISCLTGPGVGGVN